MHFSFIVPGKPVPKARPRMGRGGRVFTPQKTAEYEALIARCARGAKPPNWPTDGQYRLAVVVYFDGNVFGDLDNYVKAAGDGLNHADVWQDDKYVSSLTASRVLVAGAPHMAVTVTWEPREVFQKTKRSRKVAR